MMGVPKQKENKMLLQNRKIGEGVSFWRKDKLRYGVVVRVIESAFDAPEYSIIAGTKEWQVRQPDVLSWRD